LITNEIFRRVEPNGLTMGEYFEQNIKNTFDLPDIYLRMNDQDISKTVEFNLMSIGSQMKTTKNEHDDDKLSVAGSWREMVGNIG
jgi:hypothetical protein